LVKEFGKEDEVLPKILQGIADSLGIVVLVGGGAVISGVGSLLHHFSPHSWFDMNDWNAC
jgi:threonine dehydratase